MRNRIGAVRDKLFRLANEIGDIAEELNDPEEHGTAGEVAASRLEDAERLLRNEFKGMIDDALRALPID